MHPSEVRIQEGADQLKIHRLEDGMTKWLIYSGGEKDTVCPPQTDLSESLILRKYLMKMDEYLVIHTILPISSRRNCSLHLFFVTMMG